MNDEAEANVLNHSFSECYRRINDLVDFCECFGMVPTQTKYSFMTAIIYIFKYHVSKHR